MRRILIVYMLLIGCSQGPAGTPGASGNSCTVSQIPVNSTAPNGGALVSCTDGTSALILNGTVIKPVQFCPGTPSYPSVFPEVGFMVNNVLYAVYSQNGGFLTLVSPGYYTSNAIGSRCNFTVNADYSITN